MLRFPHWSLCQCVATALVLSSMNVQFVTSDRGKVWEFFRIFLKHDGCPVRATTVNGQQRAIGAHGFKPQWNRITVASMFPVFFSFFPFRSKIGWKSEKNNFCWHRRGRWGFLRLFFVINTRLGCIYKYLSYWIGCFLIWPFECLSWCVGKKR